MNYYQMMMDEGISATRTDELDKAMQMLHKALGKCDYANRRLFFAKGIDARLRDYAKCEGLADVTDVGAKKVDFAYVPLKREEDYLIGVIWRNEAKAKILCMRGVPITNVLVDEGSGEMGKVVYSDLKKALEFCKVNNASNGLSPEDVADIVKSSDIAREKAAMVSPQVKVVIQKDANGEYRVPGPAGKEEAAACYTDDRDDAIGTAKHMYGKDAEISFKNVQEHISKEDNKPAVQVKVKSR